MTAKIPVSPASSEKQSIFIKVPKRKDSGQKLCFNPSTPAHLLCKLGLKHACHLSKPVPSSSKWG